MHAPLHLRRESGENMHTPWGRGKSRGERMGSLLDRGKWFIFHWYHCLLLISFSMLPQRVRAFFFWCNAEQHPGIRVIVFALGMICSSLLNTWVASSTWWPFIIFSELTFVIYAISFQQAVSHYFSHRRRRRRRVL